MKANNDVEGHDDVVVFLTMAHFDTLGTQVGRPTQIYFDQ